MFKQLAIYSSILLVTGCQTFPEKSNISQNKLNHITSDVPEVLKSDYRKLYQEGDKNSVLNRNKIAVKALENAEIKSATESLDQALLAIDGYYGSSESAKKARSKFNQEDTKKYLGEPYERAMTNYYRGLTYLFSDDYDNARASFIQGQLQDSMAYSEKYQADFSLLYLLEGWASHCDGNESLASEAYTQAQKINADLKIPKEDENVLFLIEYGKGPEKYATGKHKQLLKFRNRDYSNYQTLRADISGQKVDLFNTEDIYYQASTRGGREIDVINEGKAVFKDNMSGTGDALLTTGAALAMNSTWMSGFDQSASNNMAAAGGIAALIGVGAKLLSNATKPKADTRSWTNLPAKIYTATGKKDTRFSQNSMPVSIYDENGNLIGKNDALVGMSNNGCAVVWTKMGGE